MALFSMDNEEVKKYRKIIKQRETAEASEEVDRNLKSLIRLLEERNTEDNRRAHFEEKNSEALQMCTENLRNNLNTIKKYKRVRKGDR